MEARRAWATQSPLTLPSSLSSRCKAFVRGQLLNHKRKAQLEDHLQGDQAEQRVVVALLDGSEEAHNEQHRSGAAHNVHSPRQKGVGDGAIQPQRCDAFSLPCSADELLQALRPTNRNNGGSGAK